MRSWIYGSGFRCPRSSLASQHAYGTRTLVFTPVQNISMFGITSFGRELLLMKCQFPTALPRKTLRTCSPKPSTNPSTSTLLPTLVWLALEGECCCCRVQTRMQHCVNQCVRHIVFIWTCIIHCSLLHYALGINAGHVVAREYISYPFLLLYFYNKVIQVHLQVVCRLFADVAGMEEVGEPNMPTVEFP